MKPGEAVSALEVASSLPLLRYWVGRYYGRLDPMLREELVAETALELVGRHRRNPALRVSRWMLLRFAAGDAVRRVFRNSGRVEESPSGDYLELAIPPNQYDAERLRERIADELVEDALEEFALATPSERRARDRSTRLALGTSPDPMSIKWPTLPLGYRQSAK